MVYYTQMAKVRKTETANDVSSFGIKTVSSSDASDVPQGRRSRRKRLPIYLSEDGKADLSLLDESSRNAIRQSLVESHDESQPSIDPCVCGVLISAISSLEATILSSRYGMSRDKMLDIIGPHEPIRTLLSETLAKVLSKWNTFGRYHDEIVLLGLLAAWQGGVIDSVRSLADGESDSSNMIQ